MISNQRFVISFCVVELVSCMLALVCLMADVINVLEFCYFCFFIFCKILLVQLIDYDGFLEVSKVDTAKLFLKLSAIYPDIAF